MVIAKLILLLWYYISVIRHQNGHQQLKLWHKQTVTSRACWMKAQLKATVRYTESKLWRIFLSWLIKEHMFTFLHLLRFGCGPDGRVSGYRSQFTVQVFIEATDKNIFMKKCYNMIQNWIHCIHSIHKMQCKTLCLVCKCMCEMYILKVSISTDCSFSLENTWHNAFLTSSGCL